MKPQGFSIGAFLITTLLCTGCVSQILPTTVATSTPSAPWAVWHDGIATYSDPVLGFQIDVPSNWSILPSDNPKLFAGTTYVQLFSPCFDKSVDVIPPCTKLEIDIYKTNVNDINEIRQLVIKADEQGSPETVIEDRHEFELNSIPAIWTKSINPDRPDIIEVILLINSHAISVRAYGELQPVNEIIESIKPLAQSITP